MEKAELIDRQQPMFLSLEDIVADESMARVIDRFTDVCDLKQMRFQSIGAEATGRPAYAAAALSRLYVYGYTNGIRSSRRLAAECERNIEVMWLTGGLKPSYKTIAEFRKNNLRPLQKMFRRFTALCRDWGLVGGTLIAVDGTKRKAGNNKKNCFNRDKLEERLQNIDRQIAAYFEETERNDRLENAAGSSETTNRLAALHARKEQYEQYLKLLDESGENLLSTTDPDSRLMKSQQGSVDMAYNVQSAVDAQEHIILDYDVTLNPNDQHQLSNMVRKVKKRFRLRHFTVLADKGYYNGEDLEKVKKQGVDAIVSKQKTGAPKNQPAAFHTDRFTYDNAGDFYTCPTGHKLFSPNNKAAPRRNFFDKSACEHCPHLSDCISGERPYRTVSRSQYAAIYEEVDERTRSHMALYRLRQQIVEHPFGTVKFAMQGYYFLLRTRRKVRTEVALLFLAYNLKRAVKALGFDAIMARLDAEKRRMKSAFSCFLRFLRDFYPIDVPLAA